MPEIRLLQGKSRPPQAADAPFSKRRAFKKLATLARSMSPETGKVLSSAFTGDATGREMPPSDPSKHRAGRTIGSANCQGSCCEERGSCFFWLYSHDEIPMYNILSVSRNTRLLLSRNDTLALAGFRVISPRTPEEAPFLALQQDVEAIIVGHSVEPEVRKTLIYAIRHLCPQCLVFFVYVGESQEERLADASIDVTAGERFSGPGASAPIAEPSRR